MTSLRDFVSAEQHGAAERMTENLEIVLEKEVSCSCCVGPGVRFGPKPQNKLLQSGYLSDFDMIHSLVEVLLLPQLISLIWFSYWLTAAPRRYAFLRLKIHTLCTSAYVIIHTLCTIHMPWTHHHGLLCLEEFSLIPPLSIFLVFVHLSAIPPPPCECFLPEWKPRGRGAAVQPLCDL